MTTVRPSASPTLPPSSSECAYADLLDRIAVIESRTGSLALASAMVLEGCDPSCQSELAERLFDAVRYSR